MADHPLTSSTEQIVDASPGVRSRQEWAEEVRRKAIEHHQGLAQGLIEEGLFGSAAIQLAFARRVGAEVAAEQVDQERKRQGYVLHRHLDLKILRHLYGPKPGAAGLAHVPYTPWVNSAWPHVRGSLVGRPFLMAWRHGQPCSLGSTVSFGSRLQRIRSKSMCSN